MRPIRSLVISVTSLGLLAGALVGAAAPAATAAPGERGTITWHDCDPDAGLDGFECGTLTVPLDWDDLGNPANAEIALAIHRATSDKRIGALTFNPGGPGDAALGIASPVLGLLPAKVRNRFDFVAWDPRGTGESLPQLSGCVDAPTPEATYTPPDTGPVDWTAFATDYYAETEATMSACLAANPDVAPYLGTYYVIRDLDAMRAALGEERWSYWGMSYGTRIGFRYAREFPDRVRALLLDGSWSPNLTVTSWMNGATWNYGTAQAVFSSQFGKKMGYRLQRVIDGLDERVIIADGMTYTRWQILPAIFNDISSQSSYPQILKVITASYKALYGPTAKQRRSAARDIARPLQELRANNPSAELNINFINCRDMGDYPTIEQIARAAEVSAANNSVSAGALAMTKGSLCAGLPQDFTYGFTPLTESLQLPIKPVVINSLGDTRTEYDFGRTMANYLWGASLITYDSTQHVTYRQTPSKCVNNPVTNYFLYESSPGDRLCSYAPLAVG